ncbi:unnamed protein product [Linum trigynum]|uniref:Fe2OG dioxygenase domain-containing protein n=1 Tax=Linum trigynum TaxID=586398 RepID=A0AAV2D3M2_9ROSI
MDIKLLTSSGVPFSSLPPSYVRPESDRPRLSEVVDGLDIPVIDLSVAVDRSRLVSLVGDACTNFGIFQVINHGVGSGAAEEMLRVAAEFFELPAEEKMKLYSDDPAKTTRLSTSFNVKKEKVHNWRDYLRLHCYPLPKYAPEWPSNPPSFRETVSNYCQEIRELGFLLEELISESLGLEKDYIKKVLGDHQQGQHMAVNFYPPCPQPELTYGLPSHTDPNALTILLQDQLVAGLQVLNDGRWVAVNPHPGALVVNIGDQIQALSNGRYMSVWHRAITNTKTTRLSVSSFLCPRDDALISPTPELTRGDDGSSGAMYRGFTYAEYYKKFWSRNLDQKHCLELFRSN